MHNTIFRRATCALLASLCAAVGHSAHASTWNICSGSITPGHSNGKNQHPEIAYGFWESPSNPAFTNGTNSPSRSQWTGFMLSMVNNGQYFAEMSQYGTYGGANGSIAPPRVAPYATLYQGGVNGHFPGANSFYRADITALINSNIANGSFPHPQALDNVIYMILTPKNSIMADCGGTGQPASCCNFPGTYTDGTPYTAAECEDPAGAAHEIIEAIGGYELTVSPGPGIPANAQLADPCGCWVENVNSWSLAAYWSAALGKCVVPETWGSLYENATGSTSGWSLPPGGFPIRQGYAGSGGVVATDQFENGANGNNVHYFNGSTWSVIGNGGSQFAIGGGIIAAITMDPKYGVNYYNTSNSTWYSAGGPGGGTATGVTVTSTGVIVATDTSARPWYYNPSSPGWYLIAGAGDQFVAWSGDVLALNPTHNEVFYWTGPGGGFNAGPSVATTQIIASSASSYWGTASPGSQLLYSQGAYLAGVGRQFVATNASQANFGLLNNVAVDACYGTQCTSDNAYLTNGYGGWLMGGAELYVAGCSGTGSACDVLF